MAADDALREIRLQGKQLVFVFMSATVVLVVVFLCGVLVGRGVRAHAVEGAASAPADPTVPPAPIADLPAAMASAGNAPIQEPLTYPTRLEDPTPAAESIDPTASPERLIPARPDPAPKDQPRKERAPEASGSDAAGSDQPPAAPAGASAPAFPEPAGTGFVVQVAAVRERAEAETIARRLAAKGYPSFVTTPGAGAPTVFRVRVGKYPDRAQADAIARRLQREEQFKPWITR